MENRTSWGIYQSVFYRTSSRARWEMKKSFRFREQVFFTLKFNSRNILFMKLFHFRTPTFANFHFLSSSRSFYGLVCPSVCRSVGKINIASGTSPHIGAQQNKSEWNWFCLDLNILDFQVSDYDSSPLSARGAMALKLSDPQFPLSSGQSTNVR